MKNIKILFNGGKTVNIFFVKNVCIFTEKILPKYYKHNNYSSFIRQLNMYDFHKKKVVKMSIYFTTKIL